MFLFLDFVLEHEGWFTSQIQDGQDNVPNDECSQRDNSTAYNIPEQPLKCQEMQLAQAMDDTRARATQRPVTTHLQPASQRGFHQINHGLEPRASATVKQKHPTPPASAWIGVNEN